MLKKTCLFVQLLLLGFIPSLLADEIREWTSKDGSQKLSGKLVSQTTTSVTIQEESGGNRSILKSFLASEDLEYLTSAAQASASNATDVAKPSANQGTLKSILSGKLIDSRGKNFELDAAADPGFYLFYYSASWCPPCRTFTPELVRFFGRYRAKGNLQVILVPSDKSEEDSIAYLKDYRMPWPALKLSEASGSDIPRSRSTGIPAMVLTDKDGAVLLASGAELPRGSFLEQTESLLAGKSSTDK